MNNQEPKKIFYVDLPNPYSLGDMAEWTNVATFYTREEAIQFIKDNIDGSSEDGTIRILTEGIEY